MIRRNLFKLLPGAALIPLVGKSENNWVEKTRFLREDELDFNNNCYVRFRALSRWDEKTKKNYDKGIDFRFYLFPLKLQEEIIKLKLKNGLYKSLDLLWKIKKERFVGCFDLCFSKEHFISDKDYGWLLVGDIDKESFYNEASYRHLNSVADNIWNQFNSQILAVWGL